MPTAEVKVSFNQKTWAPDGSFYRGRLRVPQELFLQYVDFVQQYLKQYDKKILFSEHEMKEKYYLPRLSLVTSPDVQNPCLFLSLTQRDHFVFFLKENHIFINLQRVFHPGYNYYLEII